MRKDGVAMHGGRSASRYSKRGRPINYPPRYMIIWQSSQARRYAYTCERMSTHDFTVVFGDDEPDPKLFEIINELENTLETRLYYCAEDEGITYDAARRITDIKLFRKIQV